DVAGFAFDPRVILRCAGEVEFGPADEMFGMLLDPGMAEAHMIWDEIEHELEAALLESLAQPGEGTVAAKVGVDRVTGNSETRTGDVFVAQIRQRLAKFFAPFGIAPRDLLCLRAGLPDAEKPDKVKALRGQCVQFGVGNVIKGCASAQRS